MIICLAGTNPYDFSRLIKIVDQKIARNQDLFIQLGNTEYIPKNARYERFIKQSQLKELIKESELVITQGGYGSMLEAVFEAKKTIAVPRYQRFNECLDDQEELVRYYESKKYLLGCYDISQLEIQVEKCLSGEYQFLPYQPESENKISTLVENFILER